MKEARFHYSWLLIIIDFEACHTPRKHVQFLDPKKPEFFMPWHGNLWPTS